MTITIYIYDGIVRHIDGLPMETEVEIVDYDGEGNIDEYGLKCQIGNFEITEKSAGFREWIKE